MSEPTDEPKPESAVPSRGMPPPVKGAIGIAAAFLGMQVLHGAISAARGEVWPIQALFSTGVAALILYGLVRKHRLAWQWGRVLGIFLGILLLLVTTVTVFTAEQIGGTGIALLAMGFVMAFGLLAMSQLLGRRESREYYRLVCPQCGSTSVKAADFFFNKAVCPECRLTW